MNQSDIKNEVRQRFILSLVKTILLYCGAAFLSFFLVVILMRVWKVDLSIPFNFGGDTFFTALNVKGMINNGWALTNKFVGMPWGLKLQDFPIADSLHLLIIKLITMVFPNWALSINLFFLLTFPLITITSILAFRQFKVSFSTAIFGSLLYTFLPFHFLRGLSHLFLASYYMVPISTLLALWVFSGDLYRIESGKILFNRIKLMMAVLAAILIASSGIYYAFFTCFFLLVAGLISWFKQKKVIVIIMAGILVVSIGMGVIVNIAPTIVQNLQEGPNLKVAARNPIESEIYGLKMSQLLLPVSGHRVRILANLKERYNLSAPLVNENNYASLGIIGGIGFLILLGLIFVTPPFNRGKSEIYSNLSYLNLSAFLLATIGGAGSLVAFFFPSIRAYNRISVFIGFFSISIIVLLLNDFYKRFTTRRTKFLFHIGLAILLLIGIYDQTPNGLMPSNEIYASFQNDQKFVSQIENILPKKAMIFQLPYVPFPENSPVYKMNDYDHFKGYLYSKTLRWSYGAMKGRRGDQWQSNIVTLPIEQFIKTIIATGFSGIYIDRYGYSDNGKELEAKLFLILRNKPIESDDKRLAFYNVLSYKKRLLTQINFEKLRQECLGTPLLSWEGGFSELEGTATANWRWCAENGQLRIYNLLGKSQRVKIRMTIATGYSELSDLLITSKTFKAKLKVNMDGVLFVKTITVAPGANNICITCNAKRIYAPCDPRYLIFRVNNFKIRKFKVVGET